MPQSDHVLLVRHGRGRGRLYPALQQGLDYLAEANPDLADRIQVYETGQQMPDLEGTRAVVFFLGDPLALKYPDCYRRAVRIAKQASDLGIPVANKPEALARHRKSHMADAWQKAGVPTVPCVRFENARGLRGALSGFSGPVIVRGDEHHGQENAFVLDDSRKPVDMSAASLPIPGVVSELVDTRASYRARRSGSVFAKYYHKYRTFLFGDEPAQSHLLFSRHPVVEASNSIFMEIQNRGLKYKNRFGAGRRNGLAQRWIRLNRDYRNALEAERTFLERPVEHEEILRKAVASLSFDVASIDYAVDAYGEPLLWEANPYPYIDPWPGGTLWRERDLKMVNRSMYDALGSYLGSLLDA